MSRQPQHNAERELCRDVEFYCRVKGCEELQKECRDKKIKIKIMSRKNE